MSQSNCKDTEKGTFTLKKSTVQLLNQSHFTCTDLLIVTNSITNICDFNEIYTFYSRQLNFTVNRNEFANYSYRIILAGLILVIR